MPTPSLLLQGKHELQRNNSRNKQHRRVAEKVYHETSGAALPESLLRSDSREPAFEKVQSHWPSTRPYVESYVRLTSTSRYFTSSLRAPKLRSLKVKKLWGTRTPLCRRFLFDTPHAGLGCCEAPCQEQLLAKSFVTAMMSIRSSCSSRSEPSPLTAPACHIDDETSTHVPRTSARPFILFKSQTHTSMFFELPAQLFATLPTLHRTSGRDWRARSSRHHHPAERFLLS